MTAGRPNDFAPATRTIGMGFKTDLSNGVISLLVSLAVTAAAARSEESDEWSTGELLAAVGIASFLSGYLTSYFAK